MFKKLILLVLVALLTVSTVTACSKTTEEVAPPAIAATEQPTTPNTPTTTDTTPTPQTITPAEKPSNPEKVISLAELVKRVENGEYKEGKWLENGEYKEGDIVLVSGIIHSATLDSKSLIPSDKSYLVHGIFLSADKTSPPLVNVVLEEETKVKVGDKITVRGVIGFNGRDFTKSPVTTTERIWIKNAVIQ
jgi:hypothetical protein